MNYSDRAERYLRLLALGFGIPGLVLALWLQMSTDFGMSWSQIGLIVLITAIVYTVLGWPEYFRERKKHDEELHDVDLEKSR